MLDTDESYQQKIAELYRNKRFIPMNSPLLQEKHQQEILHSFSINDFFEECQLDCSLSYNEAVSGHSKIACMYALYAIRYHSKLGKWNLNHIQVAQGFIGYTPHTWLVLDDTYIVDFTLAQFTTIVIPKISILLKEQADSLYEETVRYSWIKWTEIESEPCEIPV